MGRSPCCDKVGLKKGPWTPEEDQKLLAYIEEHGHGSWRALPSKAGLQRCGKSCRLRWTNYLRPDIKRGKFSLQEEQTIIQLHALLGNRWSAIANHLPKRTDNEIKNYWNTHLKKRLDKMGIDPVTHKPRTDALLSTEGQPKHKANLSHMAQWESARLEAEARLARQSKLRPSNFQQSPLINKSSEFASPSGSSCTTLNPPIPTTGGPPRCLDVLKALNGSWIKPNNEACPNGGNGGATADGGADLESPTSTVSYTEIMKQEYRDYGTVDNSLSLASGINEKAMTIESAWTQEESLEAKSEHVPCGNFVETFTDLLLRGSGHRSFFEDDEVEADNGGGDSRGNGTTSDYCEDDKNYWNSILNLVNSSPSDSPVF